MLFLKLCCFIWSLRNIADFIRQRTRATNYTHGEKMLLFNIIKNN